MNGPCPHIVFTGGGTGGHLFPGLAVAEALTRSDPSTRITFAGSGRPFERRHVEAAGFEYLAIPCRPMPPGPLGVPRFLAANLAGFLRASGFLRRERVRCVVGLGGYASAPMARAAVRRRVGLVLLEQNAVPGRATRWLARAADAVCLARDAAREHLPRQCRVHVTGNPVRASFFSGGGTPQPERPRQILVLGGSSGARSLNEQVPRAFARLGACRGGWRILHQSGPDDVQLVRDLYASLGIEAVVVPFLDDMPGTLATTRLAISRAGGTALAELSAAGVPAALVPYPHAADDHQRKNAREWVARGGCVLVDERDASGDFSVRLANALAPLMRDEETLSPMAQAMQDLARPAAALEVARIILRDLSTASRTCGV